MTKTKSLMKYQKGFFKYFFFNFCKFLNIYNWKFHRASLGSTHTGSLDVEASSPDWKVLSASLTK